MGRGANLAKCWKNVNVVAFLYFLIFSRMCKREASILPVQNLKNFPDFPGKMTLLPVLAPFSPVATYNLAFPDNIFFLKMKNNRAIHQKTLIMFSLRLWI